MTKRVAMLPTVLAGAVALALSMPAFAAEGSTDTARTPAAMIKLDFGAGRKVQINCGDSALQACFEASKPLIDKVAATPPANERKCHRHDRDRKDGERHAKGAKGAKGTKGAGAAGTGTGGGAGAPAEGMPKAE